MVNNKQDLINLSTKIASYYPMKSKIDKLDKLYKEAVKSKALPLFEAMREEDPDFDDFKEINGYILRRQYISPKLWNLEAVNEVAEDELGILPYIKKVTPNFKKKYDLSEFEVQHPPTASIQPLNRKNKVEKEQEVSSDEELLNALSHKTLDELIDDVDKISSTKSELTDRYKTEISQLDKLMKEHSVNDANPDPENVDDPSIVEMTKENEDLYNYRFIQKKSPVTYDLEQLYSNENPIKSNVFFSVEFKDDGLILQSLFSSSEYTLLDNQSVIDEFYDEITFSGGTLFINGIEAHFADPISSGAPVQKKTLKSLYENGRFIAYTEPQKKDSAEVIRSLPVDSGKVESFIDKGFLKPDFHDKYQRLDQTSEPQERFEVISKEADNKRKSSFVDKNIQRGQDFRKDQENWKETKETLGIQ